MADRIIIIQVDGLEVESTIDHQQTFETHDSLRIVSVCKGQMDFASLSIAHRAGYTAEQAEYDIEQTRWMSAVRAAGKAHIRSLLPQVLSPKDAATANRRLTQPEHPKPNSNTRNTGDN